MSLLINGLIYCVKRVSIRYPIVHSKQNKKCDFHTKIGSLQKGLVYTCVASRCKLVLRIMHQQFVKVGGLVSIVLLNLSTQKFNDRPLSRITLCGSMSMFITVISGVLFYLFFNLKIFKDLTAAAKMVDLNKKVVLTNME